MDVHIGYRFLLVFLIIGVNAFFSGAEVALLAVRQSRLKQLAEDDESGALAALSLLANPERMLSTVQVGVTLASLGLGWAGEPAVFALLSRLLAPLVTPASEPFVHGAAFAVSFLVITYFHVVIGEVVPKNLSMERADQMAMLLAPPLLFFNRLSGPFVHVIEKSAAGVSRAIGLKGGGAGPGSHSVEELKFILSSSQRHGHIEIFEEKAIHRLLDLRDLSAREVMVPRNQIVSVPDTVSLDELLRVFQENKYSRVPVYEREPENIHGILYAKDILELWQQRRVAAETHGPSPQWQIRRYSRKPLVVPETKPLGQLIEDFRHSHSHMALVVDEFGTVVGLVTLEDVMEQVFGEIEDEHDLRLPPRPVTWDTIEVDGATPIRDLETQFGIELPAQAGFETLAGFLLFKLGAIPSEGASVEHEGRRFTVVTMERNRVAKVLVERLAHPAE